MQLQLVEVRPVSKFNIRDAAPSPGGLRISTSKVKSVVILAFSTDEAITSEHVQAWKQLPGVSSVNVINLHQVEITLTKDAYQQFVDELGAELPRGQARALRAKLS